MTAATLILALGALAAIAAAFVAGLLVAGRWHRDATQREAENNRPPVCANRGARIRWNESKWQDRHAAPETIQ